MAVSCSAIGLVYDHYPVLLQVLLPVLPPGQHSWLYLAPLSVLYMTTIQPCFRFCFQACLRALQFRDAYLHAGLDPAADAVEVHDVLGAYSRIVLGYIVQRISAFHHIYGVFGIHVH